MNLLNINALSKGVSSTGLEKMIIPSILLHLFIIALVIAAPKLQIKRTSYAHIYTVSLVSAPSKKPLLSGVEKINKDIGKILPVTSTKNLQKVFKVKNKNNALPKPETEAKLKPEPQTESNSKPNSIVQGTFEPEERIKTGEPGFPEQRTDELTNRGPGFLYGTTAKSEEQNWANELINTDGSLINYSSSARKSAINRTAPSFIINPKPLYPTIAIKKKMEGVVLLRVEVLTDGGVGKIEVYKSSGHKILDESALEAVKNWKFLPAKSNGVSIKVMAGIPIRFELKR
ncbi:MAG: energy transducer TonB [Pseudomonadota bacterium]